MGMFRRRVVACARRSYAAAAGGGGAKTKAASGASGGAETDVVKRVFSEQQQKFRALLEKSKTLSPPVGGDATAVKAYAAKKLAILKELQIASPGEKIADAIDGAYAEATTVRGFLEHASELRQALGLRDGDDTIKVMVAALDETEKALGKALAMDNAQGMAQYGTAVAKAAEAAGIKPLDAAAMDKLKEEVDYEAIEGELAELQAVADDVNAEKV